MVDTDAVTVAWDAALRAPEWSGAPVWLRSGPGTRKPAGRRRTAQRGDRLRGRRSRRPCRRPARCVEPSACGNERRFPRRPAGGRRHLGARPRLGALDRAHPAPVLPPYESCARGRRPTHDCPGPRRLRGRRMRDSAVVSATAQIEVRRLGVTEVRAQLDGLAAVLHDCVDGGASVSYMAPFSLEQARSAFEGFVAEAEQGRRLVLAAFARRRARRHGAGDSRAAAESAAPRRDRQAPRPPPRPREGHRPAAHGARRGRGASGGQDAARARRRDRRRCRAPLRAHGLDHGRRRPRLRALSRRAALRHDLLLESALAGYSGTRSCSTCADVCDRDGEDQRRRGEEQQPERAGTAGILRHPEPEVGGGHGARNRLPRVGAEPRKGRRHEDDQPEEGDRAAIVSSDPARRERQGRGSGEPREPTDGELPTSRSEQQRSEADERDEEWEASSAREVVSGRVVEDAGCEEQRGSSRKPVRTDQREHERSPEERKRPGRDERRRKALEWASNPVCHIGGEEQRQQPDGGKAETISDQPRRAGLSRLGRARPQTRPDEIDDLAREPGVGRRARIEQRAEHLGAACRPDGRWKGMKRGTSHALAHHCGTTSAVARSWRATVFPACASRSASACNASRPACVRV